MAYLTFPDRASADAFCAKLDAAMGLPDGRGTERAVDVLPLADGTYAVSAEPYVLAQVDVGVLQDSKTALTRQKVVASVTVAVKDGGTPIGSKSAAVDAG